MNVPKHWGPNILFIRNLQAILSADIFSSRVTSKFNKNKDRLNI